jgi:hypothetical protein
MMHVVEMPSCGLIVLPSFIKIGADVKAVLRFCLNSLNFCNVGITDEKEL